MLYIHPDNPQPRLIKQVVDIIKKGGLIAYPTDSCYAFGCQVGNKEAMERIYRLRDLDKTHNFTLVCRDLSELANYAKVDNKAFRMMKSLTPGPYTFILKATHEVPRRLQNPKRKSIGMRVPDNKIALAILEELGEPLMSSTLIVSKSNYPETDPDEIDAKLSQQIDLIINGGICGFEATTVIDLQDEIPEILRQGKGEIDGLL